MKLKVTASSSHLNVPRAVAEAAAAAAASPNDATPSLFFC